MRWQGKGDHISTYLDAKFKAAYEESIKPRKNRKPLVVGNRAPKFNSVILQSNDYLNLSKDPRITEAQIRKLQEPGKELVMSAVFLPDGSEKFVFEKAMAEFLGFDNSVLCQSGWAANVGLLQVLAEQNSHVYIDYFAHMSLWEGIKSAGAVPCPFRHNDVGHLERQVKRHGPGIILVDSLYSTTGDIAPLEDIVEVAERYGCVTVVDESHSLGVFDETGAGLVKALGLTERVHFVTASLAKAFAGRAGIIFCPKQFADYYPYMAFPAIFSSTLLPHEITGLEATLKVTLEAQERRTVLHKHAAFLREGLGALGYNIVSNSQIIALESGLDSNTEVLRDTLEEKDVFGSVFCPPATPKNRSLVRFSLHSGLKNEDLEYVLKVCEEIRGKVGMWEWKSTKRRAG